MRGGKMKYRAIADKRVAEENEKLKEAIAWAYQAIGARWPNVDALDNLSAASQGKPLPHEWPVVPPDEEAVIAYEQVTEEHEG